MATLIRNLIKQEYGGNGAIFQLNGIARLDAAVKKNVEAIKDQEQLFVSGAITDEVFQARTLTNASVASTLLNARKFLVMDYNLSRFLENPNQPPKIPQPDQALQQTQLFVRQALLRAQANPADLAWERRLGLSTNDFLQHKSESATSMGGFANDPLYSMLTKQLFHPFDGHPIGQHGGVWTQKDEAEFNQFMVQFGGVGRVGIGVTIFAASVATAIAVAPAVPLLAAGAILVGSFVAADQAIAGIRDVAHPEEGTHSSLLAQATGYLDGKFFGFDPQEVAQNTDLGIGLLVSAHGLYEMARVPLGIAKSGGVPEPPVVAVSRLATEPNKTFFWSGVSEGDAAAIAQSKGGYTLESFLRAKGIESPGDPFADPKIFAEWEALSKEFAQNASGEARVVLGANVRPNSVWNRIELPELKANTKVTKIIAIDPTTGAETTIFQR